MKVTRSFCAVTAGIVAMSLVAAAFPSVASAANQAGDSCKKAGITLYNGELLCTKKGKKLIWVKSQVWSKPGDSCKKAGITLYNGELLCTKKGKKLIWVKSQVGLTSNANIPKVIQNWGLAVDTYDSGSGMAGVMRIRGVTPPTFGNAADDAMYRHIFGVYGMDLKGMKEPQIAIIAPLGTPVISMVDGTVCNLSKVWSNDYTVGVAPIGTPCMMVAATVLFEHEHLINPMVKVGDKVKAGQQIGTVSDYNQHWKAKGFGMIEIGVFFVKKGSNKSWHACLGNYLAPAKRDSMLAVLTSVQMAWMAELSDPTLYDLGAQNPVVCLTNDDNTIAIP